MSCGMVKNSPPPSLAQSSFAGMPKRNLHFSNVKISLSNFIFPDIAFFLQIWHLPNIEFLGITFFTYLMSNIQAVVLNDLNSSLSIGQIWNSVAFEKFALLRASD